MEQISFLLSTWTYAFIKNQFWGGCHVLSASNMNHEQKKVIKQYWINDSTLVITCPHWKPALLKSQLGKLWPSLIFNRGKWILGQTLRIKGKQSWKVLLKGKNWMSRRQDIKPKTSLAEAGPRLPHSRSWLHIQITQGLGSHMVFFFLSYSAGKRQLCIEPHVSLRKCNLEEPSVWRDVEEASPLLEVIRMLGDGSGSEHLLHKHENLSLHLKDPHKNLDVVVHTPITPALWLAQQKPGFRLLCPTAPVSVRH